MLAILPVGRSGNILKPPTSAFLSLVRLLCINFYRPYFYKQYGNLP
jgi:hypothetical protein